MNKNNRSAEFNDTVHIPVGSIFLEGQLIIPQEAKGIVLFVHGSGSSRFSVRNQFVAQVLRESGCGTLLFDLFTKEEEVIDERSGKLRFDIEFLAKRLISVTHWLSSQLPQDQFQLAYFGASTGGAAALVAAAALGKKITTVISRGGRPDLAIPVLPQVEAATLLLVGEKDDVVLQLNTKAFDHLRCEKELLIIPDATHLFEEPGTLEQVAHSAARWLQKHWRENPTITKFRNRKEAGELLAKQLAPYANHPDALILGLPRGGVPIAYEVAKKLHLPLDVFIVRKLGLPSHPEFAMGAIASGDVRVLNQEVLQRFQISDTILHAVTAQEKEELKRRELAYRGHSKPPKIDGKTVILIDDGIATGASIQAAAKEADEVIALIQPRDFQAVGQYYDNFSQTTDKEVTDLLKTLK